MLMLLLIGLAVAGSFLGYRNIYKPYHARKELIGKEKQALQTLKEFMASGTVQFPVIVPAYLPKGFYLRPFMNILKQGRGFSFTYADPDGATLSFREELMDEREKEKSLKFQVDFNRKEVQVAPGVIAYTSRIPMQEQTGRLPGGSGQKISVRFGSAEYVFFLRDLQITVKSEVLGGGELLDDAELIKVLNSML